MGENQNSMSDAGGLKGYVAGHMLLGVVLAVVVIIALKISLGFFEPSDPALTDTSGRKGHTTRVGGDVVLPQDAHQVSDGQALLAGQEDQTPGGSGIPLSHDTGSAVQAITAHGSDTPQSLDAAVKMETHTTPITERSTAASQSTIAAHPAGQETTSTHAPTSGGPIVHAKAAASQSTATVHLAGEQETTPVRAPLSGGTTVHAKATSPPSSVGAHPAGQETASAHAPASGGVAGHATEAHEASEPETPSFPVEGMAFVDAMIQPLDHELSQRFYGWRPNDILNFTDNVNNFQLGVLEVTRRTAVILAERISRTGSTAAFDRNLQNAMNWFMIKADRYWFPSAESKYRASLKELRTYFQRLEKGEALFYTRTDNLIPLLMAYQDLLGSCDENLVKSHEEDGAAVSFFKSDDYFFYAQGVVSAMVSMLEGITRDFSVMVNRRGGMEELHHAIESCHQAMEIDPWFILNSDLSSVFANHRLNMAAPISHARFYLGVLIKALST